MTEIVIKKNVLTTGLMAYILAHHLGGNEGVFLSPFGSSYVISLHIVTALDNSRLLAVVMLLMLTLFL